LQGLTLSADYVHLDIRSYTNVLDPQFIIDNQPNFNQFIIRGPSDNGTIGPIQTILTPFINLGRFIETSVDYEVSYEFDTSRLGHGDFGKFTAVFNGTYIDDIRVQFAPGGPLVHVAGKFGGGFQGPNGGGSFTHNRWYSSLFYDGPEGSWLGGLDTGLTLHYVGQYWDTGGFGPANFGAGGNGANGGGHAENSRKVREWITLDYLVQYTFNMPAPAAASDVAGYSKDGGKNVSGKDGKDKNVMPVSTAEYNPCGWRAWLDKTTLMVGIENVTDEQPPFVAAAFENGFDEQTANAKGRFWYVGIKKRF
jgi:hypothetical protein